MRHHRSHANRLRLLVLFGALVLSACSPQRGFEALALLDDLADPEGTGRPAPLRESVTYQVDGRDHSGDRYGVPGTRGAPLVLVPGAVEAGKDDPRLVATARSLARARFTVLVPDIANVRQLNVGAADAGEIAAAIRQAATASGGAEQPVVGLVAISYAVGPALIAALDPTARDRLGFVVAIGGYHDLEAVITFFTTGNYREGPDAAWRHRRPNVYGKWVFVRSNVRRLDDRRDRTLLSIMARRKLRDPDAEIGDLVAHLGPQGRAVHALLTNRAPEAVPALIDALPPAIKAEIAALDLSRRDLSDMAAEVIVIHGRDDPIIPETESAALAGALPAGRAHLHLVDNLAHAELGPGGLADSLTLWRATYRVLQARDAALDLLDQGRSGGAARDQSAG